MPKPRKPRNATKRAKKEKEQYPEVTWVDRIEFCPVRSNLQEEGTALSIISWNILANSYCSRRSQRNLPAAYQSAVFSPHRRKALLCKCLRNLDADVICLQEIDVDHVKTTLQTKGFVGIETPRSQKGGGIGGRVDSCGVYIRDADWRIVDDELIRLDDLAFLSSDICSTPNQHNVSTIQGVQQSFLRRNVALLVRIQHRRTLQTVVVANAHLYWNPGFEYVKVCQAHYVLTRAKHFCKQGEPFVFAGDLNSRPGGATHSYLTQHVLNFKIVAPWYNERGAENELVQIVDGMDHLVVDQRTGRSAPSSPRYLLDFTLNKLCRWLRIMGIDTELETEEEERLRTATDKDDRRMMVLERCRNERRTLVTTSNRLMQRKDCPNSAYCISPVGLRNPEAALAQMLVTHGVVLEPSNFLSRCVVCNGVIVSVEDPSHAKSILKEYQALDSLIQDTEGTSLEVFQCDGCLQPYWWYDIHTSSASRVKTTATRLLEICLRAGVPYTGSLGIFDHVQADQLKADGCHSSETRGDLQPKLDVIEWLKCEKMESPFFLESAYSEKDKALSELLPFTNVTYDFVDTLDYILFDPSKLKLTHRLGVPKSLEELNSRNISQGHLLPSNLWPSDHLAVGSRFVLIDVCSGQQGPTRDDKVEQDFPTEIIAAFRQPMPLDEVPIPSQRPTSESQRGSDDGTMLGFCQPMSTNNGDQTGSYNGNMFEFCQLISTDEKPIPSKASTNRARQGSRDETTMLNLLEFCPLISTNNEPQNGIRQDFRDGTMVTTKTPANRAQKGTHDKNMQGETQSTPTKAEQISSENRSHDNRCACGCVPNIPSLFEMAELRRLARLKTKADSTAGQMI